MESSASSILDRLVSLLTDHGVSFDRTQHRPVHTSEEAAEVRGTPLHSGAKALVMKGDDGFVLAVIPADLALDGTALRKHLGSRRLRFASKEELAELTGLFPGAVPPFGSLFHLPTICDERLSENQRINFNAGSHSKSIQLAYADYARVERPVVVPISKSREA